MNKLGANITCINTAEEAHFQEQQNGVELSSDDVKGGGEGGGSSDLASHSSASNGAPVHIDLAAG
jgi:hypothetical protein